jgi:hypothetical protein
VTANADDAPLKQDDFATVIAAGVLAATLATLCHEMVGHGLGCVIDGGRITLLTSIWFRCHGATSLTDAAGPFASLIGGLAAFALLPMAGGDRLARFVLILFGAISLFWFAGQLIDHAALNRDDWAIIARRSHWPAVWRPISIALGAAAYIGAIALTTAALHRKNAPRWPAVLMAYAASMASAVIAGLMWSPAPLHSAREGFLTLGIAPLGLLMATRPTPRRRNCADPALMALDCGKRHRVRRLPAHAGARHRSPGRERPAGLKSKATLMPPCP